MQTYELNYVYTLNGYYMSKEQDLKSNHFSYRKHPGQSKSLQAAQKMAQPSRISSFSWLNANQVSLRMILRKALKSSVILENENQGLH